MISLEKGQILTPLQKLPKNVGDLGKLIVAKGLKKQPKVKKIAQSGHTGRCDTYYVGIFGLLSALDFHLIYDTQVPTCSLFGKCTSAQIPERIK